MFSLQVLQIHDCAKQRRVDAIDSFGRNLSIPTDYPLEVTPIDGERAGGKHEELVDKK